MRYFPHNFKGRNLKLLEIVKKILENLKDVLPLGVRQIFYVVISLPNSPLENTKPDSISLGKLLGNARWCGEISFDAIEDKTRYTSNEPFSLENALMYYYPDAWKYQPNYVEVIEEKEGLRRFFVEALRPFYVRVTPTSGFDSHTDVMKAAKRFHKYRDRQRYILVFSDFDPSGEWISKDFEFRLKKCFIILGEDPLHFNEKGRIAEVPNLKVMRVALTKEQIEEYKLPPKFVKLKDPRAPSFIEKYGEDTVVELDALPPRILQEIIEELVQPFLDIDEVHRVREIERAIRIEGLKALRPLIDLNDDIEETEDNDSTEGDEQ